MLEQLFERRALTYQQLWGTDNWEQESLSGASVTRDNALELNTVLACVRLIGDSISTLPVGTFRRDGGDRKPVYPRPVWLDQPDSGVSIEDHWMQVIISMLIAGEAFVRKLRVDGEIIGLSVLNPRGVEILRSASGRIMYRFRSTGDIMQMEDIIHIPDMRLPGELHGRSRVELTRQNLGLAKALDEFAARFFGSGSITSGIIEAPMPMNEEQVKDIRRGWAKNQRGLKKAHEIGVLSGGAKFQKTGVDPNEAQMLESRQHAMLEIMRLFRCPPSMMGVIEQGAQSYASVEQNGIHFVTYTLRPHLVKIEKAYSRMLTNGVFIKFNVDGLLRGDIGSRYTAYSVGTQAGFLSVNDIHKLEDMPVSTGGDTYRVPLANIDLAAANIAELDKKTNIATKLILAGFDPAAVLAALELPKIAHTGVPSAQLQQLAALDPQDPLAAYDV